MAEMTPRTLSGFMELLPKPQQQMAVSGIACVDAMSRRAIWLV